MTSSCCLSWSGLEGLCTVLRRLSYPNRRFDLERIFFQGEVPVSIVFNQTLDFLYRRWAHLFDSIGRHFQTWLSLEVLEAGCAAIHGHACPMANIWGFIDGTRVPITRPIRNQRL